MRGVGCCARWVVAKVEQPRQRRGVGVGWDGERERGGRGAIAWWGREMG